MIAKAGAFPRLLRERYEVSMNSYSLYKITFGNAVSRAMRLFGVRFLPETKRKRLV